MSFYYCVSDRRTHVHVQTMPAHRARLTHLVPTLASPSSHHAGTPCPTHTPCTVTLCGLSPAIFAAPLGSKPRGSNLTMPDSEETEPSPRGYWEDGPDWVPSPSPIWAPIRSPSPWDPTRYHDDPPAEMSPCPAEMAPWSKPPGCSMPILTKARSCI